LPMATGVTLSVDHDSVTGLNHVQINAHDDYGYEEGKRYDVVIAAGTVDGVSVVGEVVGHFIVGNAPADVKAVNGEQQQQQTSRLLETTTVPPGGLLELLFQQQQRMGREDCLSLMRADWIWMRFLLLLCWLESSFRTARNSIWTTPRFTFGTMPELPGSMRQI